MFDARSEAREFVGRDRAEAVTKAAGFFGLAQEELAIAEPEIGVVAGLGARVVVVAYPRSARPPMESQCAIAAPPSEWPTTPATRMPRASIEAVTAASPRENATSEDSRPSE